MEAIQTRAAELQPINRALQARRKMAQNAQVMAALELVDRMILTASTRTPIADIPRPELAGYVGKLMNFITSDAGIKQTNEYSLTRFFDILSTYYGDLSLHEVKLAFELSLIGELDEYLPKDKNGNPDKNHYQAFSAEYITRILNAYKERSRETAQKISAAMPKQERQQPAEEIAYYAQEARETVISTFLRYKYSGIFYASIIGICVIYQTLDAVGLAESIQVTEEDKQRAVSRLLNKARKGLISDFIAQCIAKLQTEHSAVPGEALSIAKKRAVICSFDMIIREEIQITDYLK